MTALIDKSRTWLATLASLAIVSLAMTLPARAGNPVQCTAYATSAVAQQNKNISAGCGYTGAAWQSNWAAHYAWCMGAPNWQIHHETQARQHKLQLCAGGGPGLIIKTFHHPKIGGVRLDWCRVWSHQCGAPAAHAFCHMKGYVQATQWHIAPNIGYTRVISSGAICSDPTCDGFTYVRCSK